MESSLIDPKDRTTFFTSIDHGNRWVVLAKEVHWEKLEDFYCSRIDHLSIHPLVTPRTMVAAFIVKYKLKLSSNGTIRFLNENQYLQYFAQVGKYYGSPPITADLMRSIRDRLGKEDWSRFKYMILHESFSTPFARIFFNLKKHIRLPDFDRLFESEKNAEIDQELHTSLGLEYRSIKPSTGKTKKRHRRKLKKKIRKVIDYLIWTVLITLVVGSLIMIVVESDWTKDRRKLEKRK